MMGRKQAEAAAVLIESLSLPFGPEDYIKMESEKTTQLWPLVAALPGRLSSFLSHLSADAFHLTNNQV